jgi:hypothetical protein
MLIKLYGNNLYAGWLCILASLGKLADYASWFNSLSWMNGYAGGLCSLAGYFGWLFLITMQTGYADIACW